MPVCFKRPYMLRDMQPNERWVLHNALIMVFSSGRYFTLVLDKHDRRRKFFHRSILLLQLLPGRLMSPLELLSHHFQA
jgi:hypothetical protein